MCLKLLLYTTENEIQYVFKQVKTTGDIWVVAAVAKLKSFDHILHIQLKLVDILSIA